jgi:DNA-binding winged helix-turn-helix (wHTH) protein/tetratricopeptide (TPR) repeat protein
MDAPATAPREGRQHFGVFELDARSLELRKNGRLVAVRPQALKLLALLVACPGEVVSRVDIQRALWSGDTFVDFEQGVNHIVRELRAALGDVADSPRFIQTLPRRGYRFLAPVAWSPGNDLPSTAATVDQDRADAGAAPRAAPLPRFRWTWAAPASAAFIAAAFAVGSFALRSIESPRPIVAPVLTVRPFATSGTDPSAGIGLANAIAARLGGQQVLAVEPMGGGASRAVRPPGVTHVLSGEISENGADVAVVARLEDVDAGVTLWSERIRVQANELFSVENVIAERVVGALRLRLAAAEHERLQRRYTSNSAAYEDYLRGRSALVAYTPDGTRIAIQSFERALSRDVGFTLARAGLAMACADMYLRFAPAGEVDKWGERAEAEARAALAADSDLAEAHLARAAVARKREFDWDATMEASRRALVLNPNLDQAHLFMAAAYYHLGYMEEALIEMEKGRSLHGADVVEPVRIEALVALFSGKFAPARARLEEVSRLSSQAIGDTYLALAYHYSGSSERGQTMLESLATQTSASTSQRAGVALAAVLAARGHASAARLQIDHVLARTYRDHHVAYGLGAAYAQLGDTGQATRWLRIAADTGFPCLPWFERDPLLEPLRGRREYAELLTYVRTRRDASLSSDHR